MEGHELSLLPENNVCVIEFFRGAKFWPGRVGRAPSRSPNRSPALPVAPRGFCGGSPSERDLDPWLAKDRRSGGSPPRCLAPYSFRLASHEELGSPDLGLPGEEQAIVKTT